ncbi:hypothetical protein L195_g047459, partial [Trifolium pratense]
EISEAYFSLCWTMFHSNGNIQNLVVRIRRITNSIPRKRVHKRYTSMHIRTLFLAVPNHSDIPSMCSLPFDLSSSNPTVTRFCKLFPCGFRCAISDVGTFED